MQQFWQELAAQWPGSFDLLRVTFRLLLAALVGALPGFQREHMGVAAGLRTHMLVSLGAAIFMLAALESDATSADTSRVIQGLATGIGFVGAGAILKSAQDHEIRGLTTASSIWLTAGLGTAAGMGRIWLPLLGSVLALFVLSFLRKFESHVADKKKVP
ncbi:MAG: MgtC/SapB family protein [Planctomycetia bacterium]|nr:MgtC/SapB family protein [Planctomycetia bacterium]